ncbi:hypothetical protein B0A55_03722 [Friedmanniomyces simplex]|uniref:DUF7357 domain-containing protein n=1 Tax=Friedmanniomyces simplex TaxID=329884 RepID=A0A4U0XRB9_9PEZI|nr:hypothetical protein B0A55_03722 [Friedmanniomyces simplex]
MRLRLRIHRNELPPISTLWPINDTHLNHTIAQLLVQIDQTFPLESETWGLEHYIVTLDGYELLHYHELGAVCKDEDEVVIRPLLWAENRARRLGGREQITGDGRHLVDGLPFGRPRLRVGGRPEVRIPPRKRRRVEGGEDEEVVGGEGDGMALVRFEEMEEDLCDEDEDEVEDGEFEMDGEGGEVDASEEAESSEEDSSESESGSESSSDTSDTSSSSDSGSEEDESKSEASWDGIENAPPTPPTKKAASKTGSGSLANLTRVTVKQQQTEPGSSGRTTDIASPKHKPVSGLPDEGRVEEALKRLRDRASKGTAASDLPDKVEEASKKLKRDNAPPFQGKSETKTRNARKRDSKKLAHLKRIAVLPRDATLTTLHQWESSHKYQTPQPPVGVQPEQSAIEPTLGASEGQMDGAGEKDTSIETLDHMLQVEGRAPPLAMEDRQVSEERFEHDKQAQIEKQRQDLLEAIASGGVDITDKGTKRKRAKAEDDEPPEEVSAKRPAVSSTDSREQETQSAVSGDMSAKAATKPTDTVPASVTRRSKLDLAGSQRLLFGSLGVRVPKTQQEKEALQKKLAGKAKQKVAPPVAKVEASAQDAPGSEEETDNSWRSKIELTAVECVDEGVTLSTPPFPFHQRWDPSQRKKKNKARTNKAYAAPGGQRQNRRNVMNGGHVESYDKYNANGEGDALNYDDVAEEYGDDEYWEEGALLDGDYDDDDGAQGGDDAAKQLQRETAEHQQQEEHDDFPPLPESITTLPSIAEADAQLGDYITYTELACSAATNWQPSMLTRTVQLVGKDDGDGDGDGGVWVIKRALRDIVRAKEYDGEGKRIYKKFEMEGLSEDEDGEEEERTGRVGWGELVEARLLLRGGGEEVVVGGGAVGDEVA